MFARLNPLRYQTFCFVAMAVNVIALGLDAKAQHDLVGVWAWCVIPYALVLSYCVGIKGLGWPSLTLAIFVGFHPNEVAHVVGIWLCCIAAAAIIILARRLAGYIGHLPQTTRTAQIETVEIAVPVGATDVSAASVLAQFGLGAT